MVGPAGHSWEGAGLWPFEQEGHWQPTSALSDKSQYKAGQPSWAYACQRWAKEPAGMWHLPAPVTGHQAANHQLLLLAHLIYLLSS